MVPDALKVAAIIVAAGSGQRFGNEAKVLVPIAGKPMLGYSIDLFASLDNVSRIVVVAGKHSYDSVRSLVEETCPDIAETCLGGATRRESVQCGFERIPKDIGLVAVHDAARPLVSTQLVQRLIDVASDAGAAVPVLPLGDTVYRTNDAGIVTGIEDRTQLRTAQTPQIGRREWLASALGCEGDFTDEGSAMLECGYPVATVEGRAENIKITWPDDVRLAEYLLAQRSAM